MKRLEMVWLLLPMVIAGILVVLMEKAMLVRPPSGILTLTEAMSIELLALEKKGDRLLGLLASQIPKSLQRQDYLSLRKSGRFRFDSQRNIR